VITSCQFDFHFVQQAAFKTDFASILFFVIGGHLFRAASIKEQLWKHFILWMIWFPIRNGRNIFVFKTTEFYWFAIIWYFSIFELN
jgi:uncharacterized protein (DUF983 family)